MDEPRSEADLLFARLEQEYANEDDVIFQIYGVKHDCHCGDDIEAGRIEEVPACYLEMVDLAMAKLREHRMTLSMIAAAPDDISADKLRLVAASELNAEVSPQ